jgi:hypothetical protein
MRNEMNSWGSGGKWRLRETGRQAGEYQSNMSDPDESDQTAHEVPLSSMLLLILPSVSLGGRTREAIVLKLAATYESVILAKPRRAKRLAGIDLDA